MIGVATRHGKYRKNKIRRAVKRGYKPKTLDQELNELMKEGEIELKMTLKGLKKSLKL